MRKVFRDKVNADYWDDRWANSGVDEDGFTNNDIYPIKYAELIVDKDDKILEAGCGAGRVYFHYKNEGFEIKGIEYSKNAVENILAKDSDADVIEGSITELPYPDKSFDAVLAFGLYHNIEDEQELQKAFDETIRVLNNEGQLVASVRFDSLENNIVEKIMRKRSKGKAFNKFHRWHFSLEDMQIFLGNRMEIEEVYYARNVSFLFKYDFFREKQLKSENFSEAKARSGGFELNAFGMFLDNVLHSFFPKLFSNLLVVVAKKK
jgi:ubiquinone/menaquinone biosynthesis C-methylase UbiE